MKTNSHIKRLVMRHILDATTTEQENELMEWRERSIENENYFKQATDWENIGRGIRRMQESKVLVFNRILEQYPQAAMAEPRSKRKAKIWTIAAIAAAILVIVNYGIQFWIGVTQIRPGKQQAFFASSKGYIVSTEGMTKTMLAYFEEARIEQRPNGQKFLVAQNHFLAPDSAWQKLITPRGNKYGLVLPGILEIRQNSSSIIQYPSHFNKDSLNIDVRGEVYVELAQLRKEPVQFTLGGLRILARQASFDLYAYPGETTRITLVSGKLSVMDNSNTGRHNAEYFLRAGEQFLLTDNVREIIPADTAEILAWKNGRNYFHGEGILRIMQSLSKWYDFDYQFQGAIPEKKFSLDRQDNAPIKLLLEDLRRQGISITVDEKQLTIKSKS
jgi:ferric-dicitrate binding protein FerR (iron transport regulator)